MNGDKQVLSGQASRTRLFPSTITSHEHGLSPIYPLSLCLYPLRITPHDSRSRLFSVDPLSFCPYPSLRKTRARVTCLGQNNAPRDSETRMDPLCTESRSGDPTERGKLMKKEKHEKTTITVRLTDEEDQVLRRICILKKTSKTGYLARLAKLPIMGILRIKDEG